MLPSRTIVTANGDAAQPRAFVYIQGLFDMQPITEKGLMSTLAVYESFECLFRASSRQFGATLILLP